MNKQSENQTEEQTSKGESENQTKSPTNMKESNKEESGKLTKGMSNKEEGEKQTESDQQREKHTKKCCEANKGGGKNRQRPSQDTDVAIVPDAKQKKCQAEGQTNKQSKKNQTSSAGASVFFKHMWTFIKCGIIFRDI